MNKILTIIRKIDENALSRWGVGQTYQFNDSVSIDSKIGQIKIDYDDVLDIYSIKTNKAKIGGLYYDQIVDTIDSLVA